MNELLTLYSTHFHAIAEDRKFMAVLNGAEVKSDNEEKFEEIKRRAMIRAQGGDPDSNDVKYLQGAVAQTEGFGVNVDGGLSYAVE
jgi:hypothetical protein